MLSVDDIEQAVKGLGPEEYVLLVEKIMKQNRGLFTRQSLSRILGVDPEYLPNMRGEAVVHNYIILQPMDKAEEDNLKFKATYGKV